MQTTSHCCLRNDVNWLVKVGKQLLATLVSLHQLRRKRYRREPTSFKCWLVGKPRSNL